MERIKDDMNWIGTELNWCFAEYKNIKTENHVNKKWGYASIIPFEYKE